MRCFRHIFLSRNHRREEHHPGGIRQESGKQCEHIGQQCRGHKHLPRTRPDIGNGRCHETKYNQRDAEAEKLAENGIERGHKARAPQRADISGPDAECYCDDNLRQKAGAVAANRLFAIRIIAATIIKGVFPRSDIRIL